MAFLNRQVTTTANSICRYNEKRTSLVIFNNGTGRIFVSQDPANLATDGFPLDPGGAIGLTILEGDEPQLEYYAQSVAGTQDVRIVEGYGRAP